MSVTANIKLPVDFIVSDPAKPFNEIGVIEAKTEIRKVVFGVDSVSGDDTATLEAIFNYNLSINGRNYEAAIPNLDINTYYQVRHNIRNQNNPLTSKRQFINTGDAIPRYYIKRTILDVDENAQTSNPFALGLVRISRPTAQWDLWIYGLKTAMGADIPEPTTPEELYEHITVKQDTGHVQRTTNLAGEFYFENLKAGTYLLEYYDGTEWLFVANINVSSNIDGGFYNI